MAPPSRPWFRFYVEAIRDPKMLRLSPTEKWLWVAILSAARESYIGGYLMVANGVAYTWPDLARYADVPLKAVETGTARMHDLGMIAFDPSLEAWYVVAWSSRQYESDDVTKRTRKHRSTEPARNVPSPFQGTPPETDTETETEEEPSKSVRGTSNGAVDDETIASKLARDELRARREAAGATLRTRAGA